MQGVGATNAPEKADPRAAYARPDFYRFLALSAQLVLLLAVFRLYRVEQFSGDMGFFFMCCLAFTTFAVHYWLPFPWKEKFWVAVSLGGALLLLPFWRVALLIAAGAVLYLILVSPLSYWKRVSLVVSGLAVAMVLRSQPAFFPRLQNDHTLGSFWVLFGVLFMFRLIVYLHDIRYMKGRPPLTEFLAYFFILPNYVFLLFPVIDYKSMRLGYYRRDIHEIAQQGILWICRGTLQLLAYMLIFYARDMLIVHSFGSLVSMMLLTFLLYLRVSGQFHISIGLLHLFGYDLPETNHKYLLSHSLTDFWRRINIYWKDFMVKLVYFPTYFWLRKKGELRAQLTGTGFVFVVTWALHAYQTFWLRGQIVFTWPDTLFWGVLGILMILNVWWDHRHPRRKTLGVVTLQARVREAVSILGTVTVILLLWSLWSAPSVTAWIDFLKWWNPSS